VQLKYTFALMISGIVLAAGPASADDFSFSFTNDIGNVVGTVTGEILGLTDNSTGAATDVIIESFPSALSADLNSSYTAPIDLFAFPWFSTASDTFTETDGEITAADFGVDDGDYDFVTLGTGCNYGTFCGNGFGNWGSDNATEGSTISFSQLGSSTPEPSTLGLMLAGFVALTARRVRRKA
jgi:hypothetical protein